MQKLGFERFAMAGHDRGSYTAFRAAMDHPRAITHLAVLDGVPIIEALERCDVGFASAWWHWFFFAQAEKPETAILANPELWYPGTPEQMGEEAYADFLAATRNPARGTWPGLRSPHGGRSAGRTCQGSWAGF